MFRNNVLWLDKEHIESPGKIKMKAYILFKPLLISCLVFNTEADLSLTMISPLEESTINGLNIHKNVECNAAVTFVCEIIPYVDSVIWQINGQTYALCFYDECLTYPPFPENHNFTMDLKNEVFILTVSPVTNATNNNIYKCDDGITARSVKATVNVYPTSESLKMDEGAEDQITVTTGCVYPNGVNDVTFEWFITKSNTTLDPEPFISQKNGTVIFGCTEMPTCTVEETSHFNNTVIFDVSDEGEEYYIYVSVMHKSSINRPFAVLSTEKRYKVKNKVVVNYSRDEYKMMAFLAGIPFVGFDSLIKTDCGDKEQEKQDLVKYCIIGFSVTLALIIPAVWMCETSMLFLCWHRVTMDKSWKYMVIIGCSIVIDAEVLLLIQCKVLCWDKTHYIPVLILYLVMLWVYMTATEVLMKYLLFIASASQREEDSKFTMCKDCNSSELVINTYCMACKKFLCKRCMKRHGKCGQGLLRHQQHNDEREREFCCDICEEAGRYIAAAHAFCLTCSVYLCTLCLKAKHNTCTLLWIQQLTGKTGRKLHMCCDSVEEQETINYCLDCQSYFCCNCFATHRQHKLFWNQSEDSRRASSMILCRGCKTYKRLPVECYNLHNDEFLCAKCFDNDHKSSPSERQPIYTNIDTLLFKDRLREKMYSCQIHRVLGDASLSHVEVYCLVCKIYMCRVCFYRHRRIAEYWIKSQKGNMFYCNICKKDERVYPVECCNLETGEYLCANCYECDKHYSKRKYAAGQSKDVKIITSKLKKWARPCQIHKFPFNGQEKEVPGRVYCLVCKLYL